MTGEKGAIDWIESRFRRNLPVTLFRDEFRSCVTCGEIGEMAIRAIRLGLNGVYHFGGKNLEPLRDRPICPGQGPVSAGIVDRDHADGGKERPAAHRGMSLNSGKLKMCMGFS